MGKIALITGANKGIGLETAKQLGGLGYTVIVTARDVGRGEAALETLKKANVAAHFVALDIADPASIDRAQKEVAAKFDRLDVLVNNAGVSLDKGAKPSEVSADILRRTFATNFFGTVAVTQAFLPLIRQSAAGRIVNVSSILGSLTEHARKDSPIRDFKATAYDISKSAINGWTIHLAHELRDTPIKVNSGHPGWVKTDMGGKDAPVSLADGAETSVWLATLPSDGPTGGFFHGRERLPW